MEVAEVLEKAAEVLETRGWTQFWYRDGDRVCSIGAIRMATWGDTSSANRAGYQHLAGLATMAQAALAQFVGVFPMDLAVEWNDRPERTQAEVVDAFKHAAKELRNKAKAI